MKYVIDPHKITIFRRSRSEAEAFMLFAIIAAGKNSKVQSGKLTDFLFPAGEANISPFELIRQLNSVGMLGHCLRFVKMGQYTRIARAFTEVSDLDVKTCTVADLEGISGVGPKTARFFLLHTRRGQQFAVLDTHILRWMREHIGVNAPMSTPSGTRYLALEQVYLQYCRDNGKNPAELDLSIWSEYNKK